MIGRGWLHAVIAALALASFASVPAVRGVFVPSFWVAMGGGVLVVAVMALIRRGANAGDGGGSHHDRGDR